MKHSCWLRALCALHVLSFVIVSCAAPTQNGGSSGSSGHAPAPAPAPVQQALDFTGLRASGTGHVEGARNAALDIAKVGPSWTTEQSDGTKKQVRPGQHADHKLEIQTVKAALKKEGIDFSKLHTDHKRKITGILNDEWNMQLIDGGINAGKGAVTRYGLQGKVIRPKADRDGYTRESVPHGVQSAERLDRYIKTIVKEHKPDGNHVYYEGKVRETHMEAMRGAGIIRPGEATPQLPPHLRRPSSVARPGAGSPSGSHSHHTGPHDPLSPVPGSPHEKLSFSPTGSPSSSPKLLNLKLKSVLAFKRTSHPFETPSRKPLVEGMSKLHIHGHSPPSPTESSSSDHSHSGHSGHSHEGSPTSPLHGKFPFRPVGPITRNKGKTPEKQTGSHHQGWQEKDHTMAPARPPHPHPHPRPQPKRHDSV